MLKWFKKRKTQEERKPAATEFGAAEEPGGLGPSAPLEGTAPEATAPEATVPEATAPEAAGLEPAGRKPVPAQTPVAVPADAVVQTLPSGGEPSQPVDRDDASAAAYGSEAQRPRFFQRLRERLRETRERLGQRVDRVLLGKKVIDDDLLEQLEEALITSDLGVAATTALLERVADKVRRKELTDPARLRGQLQEEIRALVDLDAPPLEVRSTRPFVIMVVGVNGVGKTTTIGKLAHWFKDQGLEVLLVAGDTFRAAAIDQLVLWGERTGVPVVRQQSGSDPSAVVFDGIDAALARNADLVLIDTAGRMHTKVNLMEELKKVQRVMAKKLPTAPQEIFLVLDATTGQNALSQARQFQQAVGVTGLVLTKLDGTAKGGIVVGICDELKVPVRFIGIGEGIDDLRPFDPQAFAAALF